MVLGSLLEWKPTLALKKMMFNSLFAEGMGVNEAQRTMIGTGYGVAKAIISDWWHEYTGAAEAAYHINAIRSSFRVNPDRIEPTTGFISGNFRFTVANTMYSAELDAYHTSFTNVVFDHVPTRGEILDAASSATESFAGSENLELVSQSITAAYRREELIGL